jgi:hypothetical protein
MSTIQPPHRRSVDGIEEGTPEDQSGTTIGNRSNSHIAGRRKDKDEENMSGKRKQAWYIRWIKGWGSGMRNDIRNRLPYYWSDWTDAWNYRVVPATWVRPCPSLQHISNWREREKEGTDDSLFSSQTSYPESHSPLT